MVCFSKHDDDKLDKMTEKVSAAMTDRITASNIQTMESILNKNDQLNFKLLLSPEVDIPKTMSLKQLQTMKVTISLLPIVQIGWWTMFITQLIQNLKQV